MCVLIGLLMYFHSVMKHEKDVSNMVDCLQVVRIYSFMKEIKVYILASHIVFLFVKTENNNSLCLHSVVKNSAKFVRILEQVKTLDFVPGFYWSTLEFSQTFASVFTRLLSLENMVYFLISFIGWSCEVVFLYHFTFWSWKVCRGFYNTIMIYIYFHHLFFKIVNF